MSATVRRPTAERRRQIADTALRLIGERGLASLSTAVLAREVGVTSGALFRHYESRDDILRGAVEAALERIGTTFPDAALPPRDRILELARNRIRLLGGEPGLSWLLRSDEAALGLPPDCVRQLQGMARRSAAYLLAALREGARAGSVRSDIDPEILLVPVLATIHALIGAPGVHRRAAPRRRTDRVLDALDRLIAPPPPATRAAACRRRGLRAELVLEEIRREIDAPATPEPRWDQAPLGDLIDHVLRTYHAPLREELPRLESMARKVHKVHGDKDPATLSELLQVILVLRGELEEHMMKEEQILFPMIRQGQGAMAEGPVSVMEHEHESAGAALRRLRELTRDYAVPQEACNTWRALWHGLAALEEAMHRHIHLENNILFPRALAG